MTVKRCSAPRIVKFESKFITTVDVVQNLALLARLLTYLRAFTHALAHTHRLTLANVNNHTITHSPTISCPHAHLYTQSPHRHTNIHVYVQHTHSPKKTDILYTHTYAHTNTCLQYNTISRTHTQTHNHKYTFKHSNTHAYNYTHAHKPRAYFLVFKNAQTYTSAH